ncbi:hypothetical protein D9619_006519 [Psilocybe cf. subviscida]|uniref:Uncharacterized protein n=1 Tax=Psilocybe cf. subviscida TaxID=2480587 RepID=A0A8H5EXZ1_9AGAR|nr:hypothetical protein D9619_006519 [Psilocybe cf. subviscida]
MASGVDPPTQSFFAGDNIIVTGGNLTQNVYSGPPPNQQGPPLNQQVLDILYPHVGPARIDGRLLHNSKAHEVFRGLSRHPEVVCHSERMIHELMDSTSSSIWHHESYHPFRRNYSRATALSAAHQLAGQGALLASIILPSPSQPCAEYIVPTLAYQLAQNIPASAEHILAAIRHDPCIFERDTETQFTQLIEHPLKLASKGASKEELAKWPSIVVVDGNARQFSSGSVPQQVVQFVRNLSADDNLGIHLSLALTSSTTIVDKTIIITLTLQQYTDGDETSSFRCFTLLLWSMGCFMVAQPSRLVGSEPALSQPACHPLPLGRLWTRAVRARKALVLASGVSATVKPSRQDKLDDHESPTATVLLDCTCQPFRLAAPWRFASAGKTAETKTQ